MGFPCSTAERFANELYDFGNSLALFTDKYKLCLYPQLAKRKMRCAVFHKNYIFVYKVVNDSLIIYNVIHVKTNPLTFTT